MRVRELAKLLSNGNQEVTPQSQERKEATEGEKKKKVTDEIDVKEDNLKEAKPIGHVVKISGEGERKRNHFASFDFHGVRYDIKDFVMLQPIDFEKQKPYVAIIKDITQTCKGIMWIKVQWFYRPEDTEKSLGGNWKSNETRELYYSFHQDENLPESIMHKCVVHFIPLEKQIPSRKQNPGFIVQKVYDPQQKRLFKFTDNVYEEDKTVEIHLLIQRTVSRIGELPNIYQNDQMKKKSVLVKNQLNA